LIGEPIITLGKNFYLGDLIMIVCYEVSLFYSAHPDGPIQSLRALQALNPIKEGVFSLTGVSVS
jgi:hypothetical protein